MRLALHLVLGLVFGLGLVLSGMANPAKVLNFLDLAGTWDPSLAFVMAGAIGVGLPAFRWIERRPTPLLEARFDLPPRWPADAKLIVGAAVFGVGWGLAGLCPGPALVALPIAAPLSVWFGGAMMAGIALAAVLLARTARGDDG